MTKRRYTHVKELLPVIKEMVEQGKTQREIAKHYGFKDKMVVKKLLERERKKSRTIPKWVIGSRQRHFKSITVSLLQT